MAYYKAHLCINRKGVGEYHLWASWTSIHMDATGITIEPNTLGIPNGHLSWEEVAFVTVTNSLVETDEGVGD